MDTKTAARRAVEFIWEGQDGLFELAHHPHERAHYTKTEALHYLVRNRYFAPLARKSRGSKKENVADVGNVLWADIDSLDGFDDRLQRLLPNRPSLVVFSGMKGFWIYLKLSEFVPTKKIESLNSGLAALLDADHCWNRDRIARLPGSIHQSSGKRAEVVEFSGLVHAPVDLAFLMELAPRHKALRFVTENQTTKELIQTWRTTLPTKPTRSTAYRMLWQFREADFIHKEGKVWKLTELGKHHTKTGFSRERDPHIGQNGLVETTLSPSHRP
jgi:hypothetical protein